MSEQKHKYSNFQRILAMIGVILLISLSICALVFAVIDFPGSGRLSWACLMAAIIMPILLWIWIFIYGQMTRKKTIATFWPESDKSDEADELENDKNIE